MKNFSKIFIAFCAGAGLMFATFAMANYQNFSDRVASSTSDSFLPLILNKSSSLDSLSSDVSQETSSVDLSPVVNDADYNASFIGDKLDEINVSLRLLLEKK